MNEQLLEISKWIMKLDPNTIDVLTQKHSPRVMTPIGKELFKESGAEDALNHNIDILISKLEAISPKTAYDVEDKAKEVLLGCIDEPMFNDVKKFIYYSPEKLVRKSPDGEDVQIPLSLLLMIQLMSIELRDRYLNKYPDIK